MGKSKGIIHLLPLFFIAALIIVAIILVFKGVIKKPSLSKESKVELKTEYKNPFDKNTQYVNPFDQFKSPLYSLK